MDEDKSNATIPAPSWLMALNMPTVQKQTMPTMKTCAIGVWYHAGYEILNIFRSWRRCS